MNNKVSRLSLSLSLSAIKTERRGGTGLTCRFSDRLPKGGLRLSDGSQRLSDLSGGDS